MHSYGCDNLGMARPKGQPIDRDELKERHALMLTPSAWENLGKLTEKLGYKSKSDLIEAIAREEIEIIPKQNGD